MKAHSLYNSYDILYYMSALPNSILMNSDLLRDSLTYITLYNYLEIYLSSYYHYTLLISCSSLFVIYSFQSFSISFYLFSYSKTNFSYHSIFLIILHTIYFKICSFSIFDTEILLFHCQKQVC